MHPDNFFISMEQHVHNYDTNLKLGLQHSPVPNVQAGSKTPKGAQVTRQTGVHANICYTGKIITYWLESTCKYMLNQSFSNYVIM